MSDFGTKHPFIFILFFQFDKKKMLFLKILAGSTVQKRLQEEALKRSAEQQQQQQAMQQQVNKQFNKM